MTDLRLSPEKLRWSCDTSDFTFTSTEELPPIDATIGQERALTAIDFGLGMDDSGYNLFVIGMPGSGRSSTIKKILESRANRQQPPADWCYVYDFATGSNPEYIRMPAGCGQELKKDVDRLVERLGEEIPKCFDSDQFQEQKKKIAHAFQERKKKLYQSLEKVAGEAGFALQQTPSGLVLIPLREGQPLSQKEFEGLSSEERDKLDEKGGSMQSKIDDFMLHIRKIDEELREQLVTLAKQVVHYTIGHLFDALERKYAYQQRVIKHFNQCKEDILEQIEEQHKADKPQINIPGLTRQPQGPSFDTYRINLLIDNSNSEGAPVVYEPNPTYFNVFGRIEHIIEMGSAVTDFQMIKAGALHRANGGYLILDCREVLLNMFTYDALKRTIRNGEIRIEDMAEQYRLIATVSLKPQAIPLNCKIVLIGTPDLYTILYQLDPDFRKYFKVKVDFDHVMKKNSDTIRMFSLFVASKCHEKKLRHFTPEAVARVVEFSARLCEDQDHLSASFSDISDLIQEAAFFARRAEAHLVSAKHVETAVDARIFRANRSEERIRELIEEGTILINTEGDAIGQINGLAVYQLGDYSFGMPSRVSVRTFLGKAGMINIEREVKLSGSIHDKGLLILGGFFGERYGNDKPLALSASVCFEQNYSGVDGDSASTTELYALLSSLARLPLRQDIAVTGSVNQHGQVQPIGGVNQKIEGFYAVCKARGLSGKQGVIIPNSNCKNLMLNDDVIAAVAAGKFHIWAVTTVDEGISILTGTEAGDLLQDGSWTPGSVNDRVNKRLLELAELAANFGKNSKDETPET